MTARRQLVVALSIIAAGAAALLAGRYLLKDELFPVAIGKQAPDFRVLTLDSMPKVKTLADYRGQVVLLNIWATWCGPCRIEMPSMQALHDQFGPRGLKIVAVSIDDASAKQQVRDFMAYMRLSFEALHDPAGKIQEIYQTTGVPETVIIGRDGIIRKKVIGATNWHSQANRVLVEQLLAEAE